jgi:hypothetical protein
MRNGQVFERQTPERHIKDSEFLSLRGKDRLSVPTPTANDSSWDRGAVQRKITQKSPNRGVDLTLWAKRIQEGEYDLLPTPNTVEDREIKTPEQIAELKKRSSGGYRNLREEVLHNNLEVSWGRFENAILQWESVTGFAAPRPTKFNEKKGGMRLSSQFAEWLMGLQPGWVTDCNLSWKDELKACGNGVVPQQAKLALTILLDRLGV